MSREKRALVRHAPLKPEDCWVAGKRQGLERTPFFDKRLVDHPPGRRMHARIGNRVEPMPQLTIQIFEIAEGAGEKEVLPDIAERPLDLAFRLCPVGPAGARLEAVMAAQIEERAIVNHAPVQVLADHRGLHAVVEDFAGNPADRLKRGDMTAQHRLQILMKDEASPDQPGVAEYHREQPNNAVDARLVSKFDHELGEVDLRLLAGRRLKANLKASRSRRSKIAQ